MIPCESDRQEPGRLSEWLWFVERFIFRHVPRRVLVAAVIVAWDKATALKFGEVWFDNIPIQTLVERLEEKDW